MEFAADQPPEVEVRTFRIGPLPDGDEKFIPPYMVENLRKVQAGEAHENDDETSIKTPELARVMNAVIEEIIMFAKAYMLNAGISLTQVEASVARLRAEGRAGGLEDPLDAVAVTNLQILVIDRILFGLRLSIEEVMINHIEHGNKDPHLPIRGAYWINGNDILHIESADCGNGFDPAKVPSPLEAIMLNMPFGRGLLLQKTYMDEVEYGNGGPTGNLGTSQHMKKQLGGLDKRMLPPNEDSEADKFEECELDRHTRHAISALLADRKAAAAKAADEQAFKQAWFGLRHVLAESLQGGHSFRQTLQRAGSVLRARFFGGKKKG